MQPPGPPPPDAGPTGPPVVWYRPREVGQPPVQLDPGVWSDAVINVTCLQISLLDQCMLDSVVSLHEANKSKLSKK